MSGGPFILHAAYIAGVTILVSIACYLIGLPDSVAYYSTGAFAGWHLTNAFRLKK